MSDFHKKKAALAVASGQVPRVQVGLYTQCAGTGQTCVLCKLPIDPPDECACTEVRSNELAMHHHCMRAWQDAVREQARIDKTAARETSRKPSGNPR